MLRSWKALGEYVLLAKFQAQSEFGLIIETPYEIQSVGGFVPIDLTIGDHVFLSKDANITLLESSNPTSPTSVHYSEICAFSIQQGQEDYLYTEEEADLLYDSELEV